MVAFIVKLYTRRRNSERDTEIDIVELNLLETASGKTINRGADLKPLIQYFVCKIRRFQHFYYFHKQIKECKQRIMKKENKGNLTNIVTKDEFVIIGVIGEFTAEDRLLFPKGKAIKEYIIKSPSEAIPVLCFQNNLPLQSAFEVCHKEGACHLILVKPVQDVADKADDSIIVVDRNKENILEALTLCLEQPLCKMLQEWLRLYSEDSVILGEVEALLKTRLNQHNATDTPEVPDNIQAYLSRRSDIEAYSMPTSSSLKVFVKKSTDGEELQNDLKKLNPKFFTKYRLQIEKIIFMKHNTRSLVKQYYGNIALPTLKNKLKLL